MSDPCIIWMGARSLKRGYGYKKVAGKSIGAHRWTWMQERGPIPDGMFVCHKCDNPACVNIDHLFLGTNSDNILDSYRKGRSKALKGEKAPWAKLRDRQAKVIHMAANLGCSGRWLAKHYGVSFQHISDIKLGKKRGGLAISLPGQD